MCKHSAALAPASTASRTTSLLDCGAAVLFAAAAWRWSRVLLPTHMRPYPGTNVTLPDGGAPFFVRDPQHLHPFLPDAQSSVGKFALQSIVVASVVLLGLLAHCSRRVRRRRARTQDTGLQPRTSTPATHSCGPCLLPRTGGARGCGVHLLGHRADGDGDQPCQELCSTLTLTLTITLTLTLTLTR